MREGRLGPHLDLQTEARPGTAGGKGSGVSGYETASPPQSEAGFRHSAGAELRATPEPEEVEVGAEIESLHYEMLRAPNLAPGVGAGEVEVGVEIESLEYEMLRAPNLAPEHMTVITQHANNPLPWDDQVSAPTRATFAPPPLYSSPPPVLFFHTPIPSIILHPNYFHAPRVDPSIPSRPFYC